MPSLTEKIALESKRQTIRQWLIQHFQSAQFLYVDPPLFTPASQFQRNHPSFQENAMIQTILRDGLPYAIRPDITTMLMEEWLPIMKKEDQLRVYYLSDHFRQTAQHVIQTKECGFEVYGTFAPHEQLNMIQSIFSSIRKPLTLVFGYPSFLQSVLKEVQDSHRITLIRGAIQRKSATDLKRLLPLSLDQTIEPLLKTYSSTDALRPFVDESTIKLFTAFANAVPGITVQFDLSIIPPYDYYSGIYIKGYLPGYDHAILSGGTYDQRTTGYGQLMQAFGISMDLAMLYKEITL